MATKATKATKATPLEKAEAYTRLIDRLTDLLLEFNGVLWKVRRVSDIKAAATVIVNTLALFGFQRQ